MTDNTVQYVEAGETVEAPDAFADMQRQRDLMEDERDAALLRAEQAEDRLEAVTTALLEGGQDYPSRWRNALNIIQATCDHQWKSHVHLGLHRWFDCECGARR